MSKIESVKKRVLVNVPQERAFTVFTTNMDAWYPREHHIGKERDQLERPFGEVLRLFRHRRVVGKEEGVVMRDHTAAGARRHHDVVIATECIEDGFAEVARRAPITGIIGWLTTAGLRTRQCDLAASLLQ